MCRQCAIALAYPPCRQRRLSTAPGGHGHPRQPVLVQLAPNTIFRAKLAPRHPISLFANFNDVVPNEFLFFLRTDERPGGMPGTGAAIGGYCEHSLLAPPNFFANSATVAGAYELQQQSIVPYESKPRRTQRKTQSKRRPRLFLCIVQEMLSLPERLPNLC